MSPKYWLAVLLGIWLAAQPVLASAVLPVRGQPAAAPSAESIAIIPDRMSFSGDVTTFNNCANPAACAMLAGSPDGSILLGGDPQSADPRDWNGGTASSSITFSNPYPKTRWALTISWPDTAGKGLHSAIKGRSGSLLLDGQVLWTQHTSQPGGSGGYYAARHEPIRTTLVIADTLPHTLSLQVEPGTVWDVSQIRLQAYAMPATLAGIGYSPYRDCQAPGGDQLPTRQNIQDDLMKLVHTTNVIRTYSSLGPNASVPELANQVGLSVYPGAWLDYPKQTLDQDNKEIQGLITLACQVPVAGVIVGNEYYLRHRTSAALADLHQRIQQVRTGVQLTCGKQIAITTAEIDDLIFQWHSGVPTIQPDYKPILDDLDFVMVHMYPFWSGLPVEGSARLVIDRYLAMQTLLSQAYPGQPKNLVIGETGWPSGGGANGRAIPSPENQRKYMLEFLALAETSQVNFMYFDAFDELWKIEESNGVGQRWGYAYTDRSAKHAFYGVLLPPAELLPYVPEPSPHIYLPLVTASTPGGHAPFPVYQEWPEGPGHFVPSGWMGDLDQISMYGCDRSAPHSGEMATRVTFAPNGLKGWAGAYWQYPENNWGGLADGMNLSWANQVSFWAKGALGAERIRFFVGGIGLSSDPYPDSLRPQASTGFIELTNQWKLYTLNLAGKDLSHVIGGFGWATDRCANPAGATFYLDDIRFEYQPGLQAPPLHGATFGIYSDAASPGNHFTPSAWMGDGQTAGRLALNECWAGLPHSGNTSIKVTYSQPSIGWAGAYWVEPAENWGDRPGGFDLSSASQLTFWARGETNNLPLKLVIGGVGYAENPDGSADCSRPTGPYPDSICPKIETSRVLGTNWAKYSIPIPAGQNLRRVVGGFGFVIEQPATFYLDDIQYEFISP